MFLTIRDVAEAAGVSISTASRALSGRRKVSPEAERAVLAASQRLGYRANTVARSLRMRSTATVGMVLPGISNPYFPLLVEAVERTLSATGRELLLCDSQGDVTIESARVEALLDRRVDGLLFIPCEQRSSAATVMRARHQVPVVQVDRYVEGVDVDFVGVDSQAGLVEVIRHLLDTGCRTFAFVGARTDDSAARERLTAYCAAMREHAPASAERLLLGDYSLDWGRQAGQQLIDAGPLPDAIVCGADIIALGVIAALAESGVQVPGDVAVTGFDDIGFAAVSAPPLTTLRQPADAMVAEAVRMLDQRLSGAAPVADSPRRHVLLRPELVVRHSTRPV
jgi:LacI family transcriptional regulator